MAAQQFTNFAGGAGSNQPTSYVASNGFVGAPASPFNPNSPTFGAATFPSGMTVPSGTAVPSPTISSPTITGLPLFSTATPAAAGTTVTDATQLTAMFNAVTAADGNKGVKLPPTPAAGTVVVIKNNAGSTLKVWPDAAATINAIGSNADLPMLTNTACLLFAVSATQWWSVPLVPS